MEKQILRKELLKKISHSSYRSISIQTLQAALSLLPEKGVVAFFSAVKHELDLYDLWTEARKKNLITIFPRVLDKTTMVFCPVYSMDEMVDGSFGIREPISDPYSGDIDVFFVPGLAFSRDGMRLGFGAGYYDRFLIQFPYALKIGVVSEEYVFDDLPSETHDVRMNKILTQKEIISIN